MKIGKLIFSVLLFISVLTSIKAQDSTKTFSWLNTGIGINSLSLGYNVGLNFQIDNTLITAKFGANGEVLGDDLMELGLLVGYRFPLERAIISFTGGLAETTYSKSNGLFGAPTKSKLLGFVIESQISYIVWKLFGIGVTSYFNINKIKSITGVNLNIFIGVMND